MIFHFLIKNKPPCLSVTKACSVFELSRSGYFKCLQSAGKPFLADRQKILQTFHLSKGLYGYRKVFHSLIQQGEQVSIYQVRNTLHRHHLKSKKPKPFKPNTTQSNPDHPVAPRVFKVGESLVTRLNQVWGSDITYLPTSHGGFLYLVVFIDFFSRKIISWELSSSLSVEFVLKAFYKAIDTRSVQKGLVVHSDRGVQYTAEKFRKTIKEQGFVQSMSRKANCYDNAYCESCFSLLKRELGHKVYSSMEEARRDLFEWIEAWYNTQRIHSSLGFKSPGDFERQME